MGPLGPGSSQYGSRYSMSRTCGPRDIISLVIPRLGDNRCLCRGRVAPCHGCHCFLAHSLPFIPSFIDLLLLCFKGRVEGHSLGLVTRGDNVIHKHFMEMRRLAHDETPFLLAMPPRVTTLVW
jgi:hypothetical protein